MLELFRVKKNSRAHSVKFLLLRRVENYVIIYFGSLWFIMGHYGSILLIPLFSVACLFDAQIFVCDLKKKMIQWFMKCIENLCSLA